MKLIKLDSVDSTNQYLKDNYQSLNHLDVVTTRKQTKGKGRLISTWFSDQKSLTFSILLKKNLEQKNISLLPLLMAKVLHKVFSHYLNNVYIKWPNDIYVQDKKLSGILIESIYQTKMDAMIIGVGINLNNIDFPSDIKGSVISLKQITHNDYDHDVFLKEIIDEFNSNVYLINEDSQSIIDYCNQYHLLNDEAIIYEVKQTIKTGHCLKINNDGNLLIRDENKIISLVSGVVHKIRKQ